MGVRIASENRAPRISLVQSPKPVPLSRSLSDGEVDSHRDFDCPHYDDCLSFACRTMIGHDFAGTFSCRGCPIGSLRDLPPPVAEGEVTHAVRNAHNLATGHTRRVREVVASEPNRLWTAAEVAYAVGDSDLESSRKPLSKLATIGLVERVRRGVYRWK